MIHQIVRKPLKNKLTLFLFGDLQWGIPAFNEAGFRMFKEDFLETPNAIALGLGDYEDFLRWSARVKIYSHADAEKHQQLDNRVMKFQDELINKLSFLDGKCIGIHEGHHGWEFKSGIKSDQRLASALKAPFLGFMASTRLIVERTSSDHFSYTIISTHGNANARRTGGKTSWLENNIKSGWDANHYIMGHSCAMIAWSPGLIKRIRRVGPPVDNILPQCLQVGGFSDAYTDGWNSSYVERSGFSPQPVNYAKIEFTVTQSMGKAEVRGLKTKGKNSILIARQYHVTPYGTKSDEA